jgi:predicted outer membrane repeat protein
VTVADTVFSGNTGFVHGGGISIEGSGTYELVNNVFFNNICHSGGVRDGDGIFASGVDTLTLTNNTFLNNGEEPVTIRLFGTSTASVYNNIVWDTSFLQRPIIIFDAILFDGQAPFAKVFNNDLRGFDATDVSLPDNPENFTSGGNIIDSDPLFLDPSEGDVHLQPGSPAINAGTKNAPSLPARDFEGNSRIIDHTVDIGADEFIPPSKAMPWIPLLLLDD